jgi:hypothetical protein
MSSRHLRKALKHKNTPPDDQPENTHQQEHDDDIDDTQLSPTAKVGMNAFDLLAGDNEQEHSEDNDDDKQDDQPVELEEKDTPHKTKTKKKNKKKKKKKEDKKDKLSDNEDIIPLPNPELQEVDSTDNQEPQVSNSFILNTNPAFFSAEKELVRLFGSNTLHSVRNDLEKDERVIRKKNAFPGKGQSKLQKKTFLAELKPHWPILSPIDAKDLKFVEAKDEEGSYFEVQMSHEYHLQQQEFLACVETFDPQAIAFMVSKYPYHLDALLQLSDVYKHDGELKVAADLIERALYRIECSFPPTLNCKTGKCRLDFKSARSVFVAVFKHLHYLGRQGCSRTALEFTKLLLSFSPQEDPLASLLFIDHFAIRSKEYEFLLKLTERHSLTCLSDPELGDLSGKLLALPNFAFSAALAKFYWEDEHPESVQEFNLAVYLSEFAIKTECSKLPARLLLVQAILSFPEMVLPLVKKSSDREFGKPSWVKLSSHVFFTSNQASPFTEKMIKKFVERNHVLWNAEPVLDWLRTTVLEIAELPAASEFLSVPRAFRELLFRNPNAQLQRYSQASDGDDVSILPEEYFERVRLQRMVPQGPPPGGVPLDLSGNPLQAFLMSLLPWVTVPEAPAEQKE